MINQEQLDNYRKKFEAIKNKIPVKLKDWDELVYQDYPELVASLIYSLQELIDLSKKEVSNQNIQAISTYINEVDSDYEYFYTLENND